MPHTDTRTSHIHLLLTYTPHAIHTTHARAHTTERDTHSHPHTHVLHTQACTCAQIQPLRTRGRATQRPSSVPQQDVSQQVLFCGLLYAGVCAKRFWKCQNKQKIEHPPLGGWCSSKREAQSELLKTRFSVLGKFQVPEEQADPGGLPGDSAAWLSPWDESRTQSALAPGEAGLGDLGECHRPGTAASRRGRGPGWSQALGQGAATVGRPAGRLGLRPWGGQLPSSACSLLWPGGPRSSQQALRAGLLVHRPGGWSHRQGQPGGGGLSAPLALTSHCSTQRPGAGTLAPAAGPPPEGGHSVVGSKGPGHGLLCREPAGSRGPGYGGISGVGKPTSRQTLWGRYGVMTTAPCRVQRGPAGGSGREGGGSDWGELIQSHGRSWDKDGKSQLRGGRGAQGEQRTHEHILLEQADWRDPSARAGGVQATGKHRS